MSDDLYKKVDRLDRAVFGDRDNIKEQPGIVSELSQMNETLVEMRDSMRKINWLLITGFITAIGAMVIKGFTPG